MFLSEFVDYYLMTLSYVMLNSDFGSRSDVEAWLKQVEYVKEVYSVNGCYDFLVKIETNDLQEMKDVVSNSIRRIPNIRSTVTLRIIE
jgi:Lrp/AsnC family transcriptional regulator for asnA, asnC and gidA